MPWKCPHYACTALERPRISCKLHSTIILYYCTRNDSIVARIQAVRLCAHWRFFLLDSVPLFVHKKKFLVMSPLVINRISKTDFNPHPFPPWTQRSDMSDSQGAD